MWVASSLPRCSWKKYNMPQVKVKQTVIGRGHSVFRHRGLSLHSRMHPAEIQDVPFYKSDSSGT